MSLEFWAKGVLTATYLINKLPTSAIQNISPFQKLFKRTPNYKILRVFGSGCYPWLQPYNNNKLEPRFRLCVFNGYCPTTKHYRCFDRESSKVFISRHLLFQEDLFPFSGSDDPSMPTHPILQLHPNGSFFPKDSSPLCPSKSIFIPPPHPNTSIPSTLNLDMIRSNWNTSCTSINPSNHSSPPNQALSPININSPYPLDLDIRPSHLSSIPNSPMFSEN